MGITKEDVERSQAEYDHYMWLREAIRISRETKRKRLNE